jgi:hypothetical protein
MTARAAPSSDEVSTSIRGKLPAWTVVLFCCAIALAFSPNVLQIFSLQDDYDVLTYRDIHFYFHNEAQHLVTIARPVAALLTNLPILPIQSLDDFRWVRIFSILTVCVLGTQMIWNFVVRLNTRPFDAVMLALSVFLGLAFIYAALTATAWAPHLLTTFIAFGAYTLLGRSNTRCLSFLVVWRRGNCRALAALLRAYLRVREVWLACLVCQLAFYDYPPFALLLTVFPMVGVLFSQAPRAYRTLIACRDVAFIAVNIALYSLSTALVYLPIVRLFTAKGSGAAEAYESELTATLYANHQFKYGFDFGLMLKRLGELMVTSGDLWLLPQYRLHILAAGLVLVAVAAANLVRRPAGARLVLGSWASEGTVVLLVLVVCFAMAASPVLAAAGGFVAYRTTVAPTALTAIFFVFALRSLLALLSARAADAAMVLTAGLAFAGSLDANVAVMRLGRNEYAYFTGIVRQAITDKSETIVVVDPRPMGGPEMYNRSPIYDQRGRAVPPHDLGCFASYCLQTGTIISVIAVRLGLAKDTFTVFVPRGDVPVPGLTCAMLTGPTPVYPPNAAKRAIEAIDQMRALPPVTCATLDLAWHDLGVGVGN